MWNKPDLPKIRLGIIGTGFIARGLAGVVRRTKDFEVGAVLTRRPSFEISGFSADELVDSVAELLERSDMIVECSGDTLHATDVINEAVKAEMPVVTMNSEWHVTVGSYFKGKGIITEAEGDQGGCLAALHQEAMLMGFKPLAYVNVKGYLNTNPRREDMEFYSRKQGISLDQVTSFTDGSKVQIEQAHIANGLGLGIVRPGLLGCAVEDVRKGAEILGCAAEELGYPVADYILTKDAPGAVYIVARHDDEQAASLNYMKMGEGPYYVVKKPYHLCHLEMIKTLKDLANTGSVLLDNGDLPTISVAAIAKRSLQPGTSIPRGMGSFDVRGECVRIAETAGYLPIGLMQHAVIKRPVAAGDYLTMADVDLPDSLALRAWLDTERRVLAAADEEPEAKRGMPSARLASIQ
ncbi:MAG: NAD(P)-dependent oxidoreductase [Verrucomicrobiaceae bacterium]|nr:NAD(P)-dependent oxidoreductase [Verrucomicrobiaceae bacterium]